MSRPQRPWFRFYVEAVADPKLRTLTPAQRWLWVSVLAAARHSPKPGTLMIFDEMPMDDASLAGFAGMFPAEVRKAMPLFEKLGMIEVDDQGAWAVCNWKRRQFESDDVTERTRLHRSKEHNGNVPKSFPGTPPENRDRSLDLSPVLKRRGKPAAGWKPVPNRPEPVPEPDVPVDPDAGSKMRAAMAEAEARFKK